MPFGILLAESPLRVLGSGPSAESRPCPTTLASISAGFGTTGG